MTEPDPYTMDFDDLYEIVTCHARQTDWCTCATCTAYDARLDVGT